MKILVSAWACSPIHGSEAAVGWEWVNALKRSHDLWIIAAAYQKQWIDRALQERPDEFARVRFYYPELGPIDYNEASKFWKWQGKIPGLEPLFHLYYLRWQRAAYDLARELNAQVQFDLAHQLTFVGFRFPGHLWKLGIPFVWGPIGGLQNTPWRLLPSMGAQGAIYYGARNLINSLQKRLLRAPQQAFARAGSGVIAATSDIQREITQWYGVPSHVISEVACPSSVANEYSARSSGEPLRLAWSGRLHPGKALNFLLRALSQVKSSSRWHLDIYGDGPSRAAWHNLARELEIDTRCTWHGQVPREAVLRGLRSAHAFVTTSLKDLTSTVVLEALSNGVPVICPHHCGFGDVVTSDCGIKLPIESVGQFESSLCKAIESIEIDESRRSRLAAGALARARDFSIERKAQMIEQVYQGVLRVENFPSDGHEELCLLGQPHNSALARSANKA